MSSGNRWRLPVAPLVVAVVALVGVMVLLYPTAAAWINQYQQSTQINDYSRQIEVIDPPVRLQELTAAHRYNEALNGGAIVGAFERLPQHDSASLTPEQAGDYAQLLMADSAGTMARLRIPRIEVDLPIYHGTSEDVLQKGIGHLEGTSLPVGGEGNHAVLTGHRGLANATILSNLDKIQAGDEFTIEVFGEVLTYRVRATEVVEPSETQTLYPRVGEDLVTLVTCTPIGINSHRILVTGERILPTPQANLDAAGKRPEVPHFPWWTVALGASIVVLGGYVWWSGRPTGRPAETYTPARAAS